MIHLYGILMLMLFLAGEKLMLHLGAGSVPDRLKPVADVWVKSGWSVKSFSFVLWGVFALFAFAMLIFIGVPLYTVLLDLGRGFK